MTAPMQQQYVTRLHRLDVFHHCSRINAAGRRIKIPVFRQLQPHMPGHADMRRPGRVTDPQRGIDVDHLQRFIKLPDGTRAARSLDRCHAIRCHRITKYKLAHFIAKRLITGQALIGFGRLLVMQHDFRLAHRCHDRGVARGIFEDPDTQINLVITRVGSIELAKPEYRVRRDRLETFKHRMTFQYFCVPPIAKRSRQ